MAILPCKSLPTWGRSQAFSSPVNAYSYASLQILPHMGKYVSILPPKYMVNLDHIGKESSFLSLKCKAILPHAGMESGLLPRSASFLSFSQNPTLPFPTNPLPSTCKKGFFPLQNAKPPQILLYKLFISLYFMLFLFICIFIYFHFILYYFLWILFSFFLSFIFFFFFFSKTLKFFPKVEKLFPAFEANNRRIDTPASFFLFVQGCMFDENQRINSCNYSRSIHIWESTSSVESYSNCNGCSQVWFSTTGTKLHPCCY